MDSTPIYTELQHKLTDPEETDWGPSAPPEFATGLTDGAEQSTAEPDTGTVTETKKAPRKSSTGRSGGRRHRAED